MPWLTLTDYARHRGVYPRAVEAAIAAGRIQRDDRGLIDSEQADRDWERNTDPIRSAAGKANGSAGQTIRRKLAGKATEGSAEPQEPLRKPAAAAVTSESIPTDISEYARARAEREHYQAQLAKLMYEKRSGLLIERERVERVAQQFSQMVRDAILAVPDRLAAVLAAETDVGTVRTLLLDELREVLDRSMHEQLEQAYAING